MYLITELLLEKEQKTNKILIRNIFKNVYAPKAEDFVYEHCNIYSLGVERKKDDLRKTEILFACQIGDSDRTSRRII